MKLSNGDSVRLKDGDLLMTVSEIESDNMIYCQWFRNGILHRDKFYQHMIDLYDNSDL